MLTGLHANREPAFEFIQTTIMGPRANSSIRVTAKLLSCGLLFLLGGVGSLAQQAPTLSDVVLQTNQSLIDAPQSMPQTLGSIAGKVVDQTGVSIEGVAVTLIREGESSHQQALTNGDGLFSFTSLEPGSFRLVISYPNLSPLECAGTLAPAEAFVTPVMKLKIAALQTEVHARIPAEELANLQVKEQEQQRVFGVVPNFYASYVSNPAPLCPRHKFQLVWKATTDPITIAFVGTVAGFSQASNQWSAYGQGAQGYAKRFGAAYADLLTGSYLGNAILPLVFKQDPRYFYQGTGSKRSRILHALKSAVICKGDNGQTQVNYSNIVGNLAAGGIANLYYPAKDRHGPGVVFSTAALRLGEIAVSNIFEEFLVPKSKSRSQNSRP